MTEPSANVVAVSPDAAKDVASTGLSYSEVMQIKSANERAERAEAQLEAIRNSFLWRASAPARAVRRRFKDRAAVRNKLGIAVGRTSDNESGTRGSALAGRLRVVLTECDRPNVGEPLSRLFGRVIELLDEAATGTDVLWLLFVAFLGRLPTESEMEELISDRLLLGSEAVVQSLRKVARDEQVCWPSSAKLVLIKEPFIEATSTARANVHTGIQRVVREAASRWITNHSATIGVFDWDSQTYRHATDREMNRLMNWHEHSKSLPGSDLAEDPPEYAETIIVPWHTTFVVTDVGGADRRLSRMRALTRYSGSRTSLIFYDMVPYILAEACTKSVLSQYPAYIAMVRQSARVATISESVAQDLEGLCVAFRHEGIAGPAIAAHPLPVEGPELTDEDFDRSAHELALKPGRPMVLAVSSIEPRKNHVRLLQAAELLWREGHDFELLLIAGNGWDRELFDRVFAQLKSQGRPLRIMRAASEDVLWSAYRLARFSVFVSITEGFGLPAAESLSVGTPVLLSEHGSMQEIGRTGGVEFVNPHEVAAIAAGMRRLLTDDVRLSELRQQIASRPCPTWDDYARETWEWLTGE